MIGDSVHIQAAIEKLADAVRAHADATGQGLREVSRAIDHVDEALCGENSLRLIEALESIGTNRAIGMGGLEAVALELKNGLEGVAAAVAEQGAV